MRGPSDRSRPRMTQTPPPAILRPDSLPSHDRGGGARTTPLVPKIEV